MCSLDNRRNQTNHTLNHFATQNTIDDRATACIHSHAPRMCGVCICVMMHLQHRTQSKSKQVHRQYNKVDAKRTQKKRDRNRERKRNTTVKQEPNYNQNEMK